MPMPCHRRSGHFSGLSQPRLQGFLDTLYGRPYIDPAVQETGASSESRVRVVATEFLRARPLVVAPLFVVAVVAFVASGARREQVLAVSVVGTIALGVFSWERAIGRTRVVTARFLERSLLATMIAIGGVSTATGAFASPFLPMLFAPVGVGFAAFGRGRTASKFLGLLASLVVALVIATPSVSALAVPEPARRVVLGAATIDAAILLYFGVASLSAAHARAADQLATAGDEMARAAAARARSLEMLGAKVAHEVKNPLAAIRAIVEVMLESADERGAKRLTVAAGEVARIEALLDAYGSHEHPLDAIRREPTDVSSLVEALGAVLEARAERRRVNLVVSARAPADGQGATMFALDRDRVKEALLNLLLNALDAAPPDGTVKISYTASSDLVFEVSDDGPGMDEETLARIGTAFFTKRAGGTGLGVLLARRIAEQHGGALDYRSAPGRGTTASLRLAPPSATAEP